MSRSFKVCIVLCVLLCIGSPALADESTKTAEHPGSHGAGNSSDPLEEMDRRINKFYDHALKLSGSSTLNQDQFVSAARSFYDLSLGEMSDREFKENDKDGDGLVTLEEYITTVLGPDYLNDEYGSLRDYETGLFNSADDSGDGKLDIKEFKAINNPYTTEGSLDHLSKAALAVLNEGTSDKVTFDQLMKEQQLFEKNEEFKEPEKFFAEKLDLDKDGALDVNEIKNLFKLTRYDTIDYQTKNIFNTTDVNKDGLISREEITSPHVKHVFHIIDPYMTQSSQEYYNSLDDDDVPYDEDDISQDDDWMDEEKTEL